MRQQQHAVESVRAATAGSQLFVHGGRNNFVLEDLFVLDLAKKEWTDVAAGAHTPPPRHGHLMTVHADKLYIYGGYDELGAWSDAMFCLPVPYGQPFTAARYQHLNIQTWSLLFVMCWREIYCMVQLGS